MNKINLKINQKIFFMSDPHWNHKNICKSSSLWDVTDKKNNMRDFQSLDFMNDIIINNINSVVGQDDILVCLGDWSFGGIDNVKLFRNRIICKEILLVFGNHDHHIINNSDNTQSLFNWTGHYLDLMIYLPHINKANKKEMFRFICTHYPMASWNDIRDVNVMHLFGHLHLPSNKRIQRGRSMDVGMDGNDMKPLEMGEILFLLKNQPTLNNIITEENDHHSV